MGNIISDVNNEFNDFIQHLTEIKDTSVLLYAINLLRNKILKIIGTIYQTRVSARTWVAYQKPQGNKLDIALDKNEMQDIDTHKPSIEYMEKFFANKSGKLLSIGSGKGTELKCLQNYGYKDIAAIDLHLSNVVSTKVHFEINVIWMDAHFTAFKKDTFDYIISKHCLEHSISPFIFFVECYRILKNDALMYIQTPLISSDPFEINDKHNGLTHTVDISLLYPNQILDLGNRTGFELIDFNDQVGESNNYIFKKLDTKKMKPTSILLEVKEELEKINAW